MDNRRNKSKGVPLVIWHDMANDKMVCMYRGRRRTLKWAPGASVSSLQAELLKILPPIDLKPGKGFKARGIEEEILLVVIKAAIQAFLAWWKEHVKKDSMKTKRRYTKAKK